MDFLVRKKLETELETEGNFSYEMEGNQLNMV